MSDGGQGEAVGRVGRPHGRDGSFYLDHAVRPPAQGTAVLLAGSEHRVERQAGEDRRPILRLSGISDRGAAAAVRGASLREVGPARPLEEDEWLVDDLVGCWVEGIGAVRSVLAAPSCDLLEVGEARVLVPLVGDAVTRVDVWLRRIEVDRAFLGLDGATDPPGDDAS